MSETIEELSKKSDKIQALDAAAQLMNPPMQLPRSQYQPFFLKVLSDFCVHHGIPQNIPVPTGSMLIHKVFSHILELMARSMGKDKRDEIYDELERYKESLPFDVR